MIHQEKYDVAAREYQGTKLYVGMNVNTKELQLTIPVTEGDASVMTDLYSGKTYVVNGGNVTVTIPSAADGGTVILKRTGSVSSGSSSASTSEPKKDQTTEVKKDPPAILSSADSLKVVATKFEDTKAWNLPVVDDENHYLGFVSRSGLFTSYRETLLKFSQE